jgi:hypothetical protein
MHGMLRTWKLLTGLCLAALICLWPGQLPAASAQGTPVCAELVVNGGFETPGAAWVLGASPAPPQYVTYNRASGAYSLLLGIADGVNRQAFSSARQTVAIPAAQRVTLSFSFYPQMTGAPTTDYMELALLSPDGSTILEKPWFARNDSRTWNRLTFDLTAWQGRTLQLYFNVYNDGLGGIAQMFLDDVSLLACSQSGSSGGSGSWVTPPVVTPTATRGSCPNPWFPCMVTRTPTAPVQPTAEAQAAPAPQVVAPPPVATQGPAILNETQPSAAQSVPQAPMILEPSPAPVAPAVEMPVIITAEAGAVAQGIPADAMPEILTAEASAVAQGTPADATPEILTAQTTPLPGDATALPAVPGYWADLMRNGGFEEGFTDWDVAGEADVPVVVTETIRSGLRAAQLGVPLDGQAAQGDVAAEGASAVSQNIVIPEGYDRVALDFWVWPWSEADAGNDSQEASFILPDGSTAALLWSGQSNAQIWTRQIVEVTQFAGSPMRLQFSVVNDGAGGATGMVLDDVSLVALAPNATVPAETGDPPAETGVTLASGQAVGVQPDVTRLSLVVTMPPPPVSGVAAAAAQALTPAPTPAATPGTVARMSRGITADWPKYWWLLPVGIVLIGVLLWLMRRRSRAQAQRV